MFVHSIYLHPTGDDSAEGAHGWPPDSVLLL